MEQTPKTGFAFAPGEVMLTVEYTETFSQQELAQNIQGNFNNFRTQLAEAYPELNETLLAEITVHPETIVTIPFGDGRYRSLAFVTISSYAEKPIKDADFDVATTHEQIAGFIEFAFSRLFDGEKVTPFVSHGVTLTNLSPNWHSTCSQPGQDGSGGPGARPAVAGAGQTAYQFQFDQVSDPHNYAVEYIRALAKYSTGAGVDVVILDTAPTLDTVPRPGKGDLLTAFPLHPLIQSLCRGGTLRIYRYDDDVAPLANRRMERLNSEQYGIGIVGHDYLMRDHGLFIAGMIHSIAPSARIHLVQVLNDYGVGTLDTIANGVAFTLNRIPWKTSPLIINCSLTIQMPLREKVIEKDGEQYIFNAHPSEFLNWHKLMENVAGKNLFADAMENTVRDMFEGLFNDSTLIVAAAGNDNKAGIPIPQPRMPASFAEVIGVGALNQDQSLADYSNIADAPEDDGIQTFGGDSVLVNPGAVNEFISADSLHGILGIYTEDGEGNRTPTGWGRWAGTSFATPIIAGVLALLRADGKTKAEALKVLREAQQETRPPSTPHNFFVTQG